MSDTLFTVRMVLGAVAAALVAVILLVAVTSGDTSSLSNLPSESPIGDFPELPLYL